MKRLLSILFVSLVPPWSSHSLSPRRAQRFAKVMKTVDDEIRVIIPQSFKPIVLD